MGRGAAATASAPPRPATPDGVTRERAGTTRGARERACCARSSAPRRTPALAGAPGRPVARPWPRPGNVLQTLRRPAHRLRRLGRRPVPPRDGPRRAARPESGRSRAGRTARARWSFAYRIGDGAATLRAGGAAGRRVAAGSSSDCEVDWHERHTLLKVLFPVAVRSRRPPPTRCSSGTTERPTHFSTSHDLARYEVPGHRFADLSEHGFGVALLTDCKYGYSTLGGEMRISLLRAPKSPDPEADMGRHRFAYAVMPHAGRLAGGGRGGRGGALRTRRCAWAAGTVEPRSWLSVGRPQPGARHDQAGRGLRRPACCGCTRPTARAAGRACAWAGRSPRPCRATCSRTRASRCRVADGVIELGYRPHQIISLLVR